MPLCSRYLIAALLMQAGASCSSPAPLGADADTDSGDGGFIALESGIGLLFSAEPSFAESFSHNNNTISLKSAEFTIVDLRLIGDAASGDARTRKEVVELEWNDESELPIGVGYELAPPGLYSRVRGTVVAFEIEGSVMVDGGESVGFEAEQESSMLAFEFELDSSLDVGEALVLGVAVDLQKITEEIPFEELSIEEGKIEIEDGSEAMDKVEEKIREAFDLND